MVVRLDSRKIFFLWKSGQAVAQTAQGGGGVVVPGGVPEPCGCGTEGYSQWATLEVGGWLGWMSLEVFSNLNDSVILWIG